MTRALYLISLLGLCLVLSSAQFLPINEEDILNPMEIEFTNDEDFGQEQLQVDTPQEIGIAVSQNIASIFKLLMEGAADSIHPNDIDNQTNNQEDLLASLENRDGAILVKDVLQSIAGHSVVVGDAVGALVTNAVTSFQDAQANGEDVGVAVSKSVVEMVEYLDSESQYIGEVLQEDIDEAMADLEYIPEEEALLLGESGEAIDKFINSIAGNAQAIGDYVGKAVDNGVEQGGNTAETIGAIFEGLLRGLSDEAENAADAITEAVVEALTGLDGVTQADIDQARREVKNFMVLTLESFGKSGVGIGGFITQLITQATIGFNNQGEAKDAVEVINRIGNLYLEAFKSSLSQAGNQ